MPKFKTRKAVAKRFKVTKNGAVVRRCACARHLATAKSRKKKRQLRGGSNASRPDAINIRAILPY
jgi:large subunit ribosomal protein L35